ncbi:MAG: hypothetical protein ACM3O4_00295 [Ignavibacteriales bacterium]
MGFEILINIFDLIEFIIIFLILVVILAITLNLSLKTFILKPNKVKLYGFFIRLNNLSILALSAAIIRYMFIIWCLFNLNDISLIHLCFLIFLSVIFNLANKNFLELIFDLINSIIQYWSLVCGSLLVGYLREVRIELYVVFITILLGIFIAIYSTYFLLKNINNILINNKKRRIVKNEKIIKIN